MIPHGLPTRAVQGPGRPEQEKAATLQELAERLARMEARLEALEKKLGTEEDKKVRDDICVECSSLIGCLEDCVQDPEELRERAKHVRSSGRGH